MLTDPADFRKPNRLKQYDYSSPGSYMLTFCVDGRKSILSEIIYNSMSESTEVHLTDIGNITDKYLKRIPIIYEHVTLDNYVIMPDHVHILLTLQMPSQHDAKRAGVDIIIKSTKSQITREIGYPIWQKGFYDIVADTEERYYNCDNYISLNPFMWIKKGDEPIAPK